MSSASYPTASLSNKHDIYGEGHLYDPSDPHVSVSGLTLDLLAAPPRAGMSKICPIYTFNDAEGDRPHRSSAAAALEANFGSALPCLGIVEKSHKSVQNVLRCHEDAGEDFSREDLGGRTVWRRSVGVKRADGSRGRALETKAQEYSSRFAKFMKRLDELAHVAVFRLGKGRMGIFVPNENIHEFEEGAYFCRCYYGMEEDLTYIVDLQLDSSSYILEPPTSAVEGKENDRQEDEPTADGEVWAPPTTEVWAPSTTDVWAPPGMEMPEPLDFETPSELQLPPVNFESKKRPRDDEDGHATATGNYEDNPNYVNGENDNGGNLQHAHADRGAAQADEFYSNLKRNEGTRADSRIFHMRAYNGWVKATQIAELNPGTKFQGYRRGPPIRVLDLACGKGGDLGKWVLHNRGIKNYVGADVAKGSLKDAAIRAMKLSKLKVASFILADLGADVPGSLKKKHQLQAWTMNPHSRHETDPQFSHVQGGGISPTDRFDVVSVQFAIHYFMQTLQRARRFFKTVSDLLEDGGNLICTTVDSRVVVEHIMTLGLDLHHLDDDKDITVVVGGGACRLKFSADIIRRLFHIGDHGDRGNMGMKYGTVPQESSPECLQPSNFGLEYAFKLSEGVGEAVDLPEWLIPLPVLTALAAEAGMELTKCENFHEYFRNRESSAAFPAAHKALYNMHVMNMEGTISAEEWEISRVYMAVKFTKVRPSTIVIKGGSDSEEDQESKSEVEPLKKTNLAHIMKLKKLARESVGDEAWSILSATEKDEVMQQFI